MRFPSVPASAVALSIAICAPTVRAQWVTFQDQTSARLVCSPALGSADPQEKDYGVGDFDRDGDLDVVCVRKSPWVTTGHFPNVLLMNENGVLTDRTTQYASASTVPGSQGMLDATNDRDVVVVDVNGDGWPDLVTATTLTFGQPQYIRVPRVYINRGNDLAGNWLGFLYDDPLRINDMQPGASWNGEQRFCTVSAGDIDEDGDMDLYFGDYQDGPARSIDVNDRLLINNGAGYFTDESAARMTPSMLASEFAMASAIIDMNLDGHLDIIKDTALVAPQRVQISYNNPAAIGTFNVLQQAYGNTPYHFSVGDLNNDLLPDLIFSDDGPDRYKLMTGVSGGQATFSPEFVFSYSAGDGDDGFAGNNYIVDLDNDGFRDVIICDVDVQISGCSRRTRIYRNLGNVPNVTLQEQVVNGASASIPLTSLNGVFDVAVFDINGDGWKDILMGKCTGTQVWINVPPAGVTFTYPGGRPSNVVPGATQTFDVDAAGIGAVVPQPGSGKLYTSINGGAFQMTPMTDLGPGQYRATMPATSCLDRVRYYVTVDGQGPATFADPQTAPFLFHSAVASFATSTVFDSGFEGAVTGWTVQNTALTAGAWEVAVPNPTFSGAAPAAPGQDGEPGTGTTRCWVTQNGAAGGAVGAADVDGGPTDLISPPLDFGGTDGLISYRRWFFCSNNNDALEVAVSNNGTTWVVVESVSGTGQNQWLSRSFRVGDYVTPSSTVRVRFRASDNPNDSTTEAAMDAFKAEVFTCSPCQQQIPLATNGNAWFSICGGDVQTPGALSTLQVVSLPSLGSGLLVFDVFLTPTPWLGGTLLSPGPVILGPIFADANGFFAAPVPLGGLLPPGWALHAQALYSNAPLPNGTGQTNVVKVQW